MQNSAQKKEPTPQLLLATVKLLRKTLVFHRNWSGNILAKAILDDPPVEVEKHEAAKKIQRWWLRLRRPLHEAAKKIWHWWLRMRTPLESMLSGAEESMLSGAEESMLSGAEESMLSGAEVFLLSKEDAPAPSPKSKGFNAIVFGQSPLRLLCNTPYACFLERCSKDDLIAYMKETFREPTDMMNFASAWTEKGDFFLSGEKNLRLDFSALVEERFPNVCGTGTMDSCGSNIFRIVRFCHLERDTLPASENIFKNRFRKALSGFKHKEREAWFLSFMEKFHNNVYANNLKRIKEERKENNKKLRRIEKDLKNVALRIENEKKNAILLFFDLFIIEL